MDKDNALQHKFLAECIQNKTPVTCFLVNGVKLQGQIADHDEFSVELRRDHHKQLIYKHAISTVMPNPQPEIRITP